MGKRESTDKKTKVALKVFNRYLKSGKNYTTDWMYKRAGEECYFGPQRAAILIREHYFNNVITADMIEKYHENSHLSKKEIVSYFAKNYRLKNREAWYITHLIKCKHSKP